MRPEISTRMYSKNPVHSYKEQEITMSSPEKCILHLYDVAIQGCALEQEEHAGKALALLIDALDYKVGEEIAVQLFRLYEYCLNMVHQKNFEKSNQILRGLRETWQTALAQHQAA